MHERFDGRRGLRCRARSSRWLGYGDRRSSRSSAPASTALHRVANFEDPGGQEGTQTLLCLARCFFDFGVAERVWAEAGGEVRNDGDCAALHAHVSQSDDFVDRAHADSVSTHRAQHGDLGGGFIGRTQEAGVSAFGQGDACFGRGITGQCGDVLAVRVRHVGEAWAKCVFVGAGKGILAGEVEVIAEEHEVAWLKARADSSSGVGEQDGAAAEACEQADTEDGSFGGVSFVQMSAPLETSDGDSIGQTQHEVSCVTHDGGSADVRNFGVGDGDAFVEGIGPRSEP